MKTPTLETERIILRQISLNDAKEVFERWTSDKDVEKYMQWELHKSIDDTIEWLKFEESVKDSDDYFSFALIEKSTNYLFGAMALSYNNEYKMYELGYNIMKLYWGKGFATEASKKILEFAKNVLKVDKILARYANENAGSQRVLEKLGFKYFADGEFYSNNKTKKLKCKCVELIF